MINGVSETTLAGASSGRGVHPDFVMDFRLTLRCSDLTVVGAAGLGRPPGRLSASPSGPPRAFRQQMLPSGLPPDTRARMRWFGMSG